VLGAVVGCLCGLIAALVVLLSSRSEALSWTWDVPYGSLAIELDPLSAFFVIPICFLCALAAIYGGPYLLEHRGHKLLGIPWFFYNLLAASMILVVIARNGLLLLMAWECMALASYFLVVFEDEKEDTRAAGKTYMIAGHLGTAFLLVFFLILGREFGSLDFARFDRPLPAATANLLFVLALIGFGTKAGFMPFHVWLPEAHPAAPSHVSAVMSGVMVKTGIYGLARTFTFLPAPEAWWGQTLIAIGIVSGVWGILFALAQHDLKRLLAYSTVENIGIIALGLGVGLVGKSSENSLLAVLGFGGALLHVLNHSLFKGLLFLGAGVVVHSTGTRRLDQLGGLFKRMPWVGLACLIGTISIAGLPPFNGFAGEFLIYMGAFQGILISSHGSVVAFLSVIAGLALIGGLAVIGLTKAFGIIFLGQPRSDQAANAHEPGIWMTAPLLILATCCLLVGMLVPLLVAIMMPMVSQLVQANHPVPIETVGKVLVPLTGIVIAAMALLVLVWFLAGLRWLLLSKREVEQSITWGCGYALPTARMQYTASSFVGPVLSFFLPFLRTKTKIVPPTGLFPKPGTITTHTEDLPKEYFYRPMFGSVGWLLSKLRWLQHGYIHLYILYVGMTLVALLVWYASRV
jgi:formate hydrogenlyase subunit 3/multisubunit Na+/H+ antiporter MnhD subunit